MKVVYLYQRQPTNHRPFRGERRRGVVAKRATFARCLSVAGRRERVAAFGKPLSRPGAINGHRRRSAVRLSDAVPSAINLDAKANLREMRSAGRRRLFFSFWEQNIPIELPTRQQNHHYDEFRRCWQDRWRVVQRVYPTASGSQACRVRVNDCRGSCIVARWPVGRQTLPALHLWRADNCHHLRPDRSLRSARKRL